MLRVINYIMSIIKVRKEKKEVLIIENRFQSLEFMKNALCHRYRSLIAQDKEEGLTKARLYTPSLIILNIRLYKEGTLSLCAALRSFYETRNIPILMIADKADDSSIKEFDKYKIEGFLIEPFSKQEILVEVKLALLRRDRQNRELS